MKKNHVILGAVLVILSVVLHGIHYAVFKDMHHLMIFLVADIAFVPLEVFFVSLVLEQLIEKQEEEKMIKKMNMLVGLFYQQFGNELLALFVSVDKDIKGQNKDLLMNFTWDSAKYKELKKTVSGHGHNIKLSRGEMQKLFGLLDKNQSLIINLISNPMLLEKEDFSEVLMSTFHLMDELRSRDLDTLSEDDLEHLEIDCKRVYECLSKEWVVYMEHLQKAYPYLFYTAVKTNPYDGRQEGLIEKELIATIDAKINY